jgi:hypothetical protein
MTGLDGAGMHGPDGNLMDSISLDLDKRVGFGNDSELMLAVKIASKRECIFRPSAVPQPSAMVGFHTLDAEQIEDGPFHSDSAWEELTQTRIRRLCSALHLVFNDCDSTGMEVGGIHSESAIAITIVGSPECEQASAGRMHRLCSLPPLNRAHPFVAAWEVRRQRLRSDFEFRSHRIIIRSDAQRRDTTLPARAEYRDLIPALSPDEQTQEPKLESAATVVRGSHQMPLAAPS